MNKQFNTFIKTDKISKYKKQKKNNFDKKKYGTSILMYSTKVNKVVTGGRKLSFINYSIFGQEKDYLGFGKGKSSTFVKSIKKSSFAAKKNLTKYFINYVNIPSIKIKFKSTILIINPKKENIIVSCNLIMKMLQLLKYNKGISIKIIGSKHPVNVMNAMIKFLKFTNDLYLRYEKNK